MKSLEDAIQEQVDLTVLDQVAKSSKNEYERLIREKFDLIESRVTDMLEIIAKTDLYFRTDSVVLRNVLQAEIERLISELREKAHATT